jgi:septum site-determining protein MinC
MDQKSCFNLKGNLFTLTVLQLIDNDLDYLNKELAIKVEMMPNFFNNTPIVIDLHELSENKSEIDFKSLKQIICSYRMIPVGVKGSIEAQKASIEAAGLAILAEAKQSKKVKRSIEISTKDKDDIIKEDIVVQTTVDEKTTVEKATKESSDVKPIATPAEINQKSTLIKHTIRSGQQISAPNGDLIIIGSVSAGAEILAAGNIHIYGTLRGRALAGIKGDQNSCIFCHNLQAELISISGIYLLSDDIPSENMGISNHINLTNEKLIFNAL